MMRITATMRLRSEVTAESRTMCFHSDIHRHKLWNSCAPTMMIVLVATAVAGKHWFKTSRDAVTCSDAAPSL